MSVKHVFLIASLGLSLGVLGSYLWQKSSNRGPASAALLRPPQLRIKPWAHSLYGKLNQAMSVQISPVGGVPDRDDQELTLKAEVILNRPMEGEVRFKWSLPEGVSHVSGELDDGWANLSPGQVATAEISVLGISKRDALKTVTLHVSAASDGIHYATAGSYAPSAVEPDPGSFSSGLMKAEKSDLGLKKKRSAEKMEKVHQ